MLQDNVTPLLFFYQADVAWKLSCLLRACTQTSQPYVMSVLQCVMTLDMRVTIHIPSTPQTEASRLRQHEKSFICSMPVCCNPNYQGDNYYYILQSFSSLSRSWTEPTHPPIVYMATRVSHVIGLLQFVCNSASTVK